jgi:hypothetical protein
MKLMNLITSIVGSIVTALLVGVLGYKVGKKNGEETEKNKINQEHIKASEEEAKKRAQWNDISDDSKLKWLRSLFPKGKGSNK